MNLAFASRALCDQVFFLLPGRLKELIITAGGENVAPVPIEESIKKELPCISNAMVIGDGRKYLTCLLTMKLEMNVETLEPKEELAQAAKDWCLEKAGVQVNRIEDINLKIQINKAIQDGLNKVNAGAISNAQKIQKWTILPTDFSVPGNELGPTLKVKRHVVMKKYEHCIESMYFA